MIAGPAAGQTVYKWVDEDGNVHYSQTLPPDKAQEQHDKLTAEGLLAERIERAPTPEERKALEAELQALRQEQARQRRQQQEDQMFLATYPTEADVSRSFDARRDTLESERETIETLLGENRQNFNELILQAAAHERRGEIVPAHLGDMIANARAGLQRLGARLNEIEQKLAALDLDLEAELQRHRRLSGGPE
ncbi:MAG: DUF4124 domain-containing protein [Wenzhouxiangellaceae bacterium]